MAWSYSLLADESAAMLSQLSVMNGWFTAAAAAEVAGVDASAAASLLRDLTRWSLVVADRTATTSRFRLVEAVRAYAATHLDDTWAARKRHRRHYVELVQRLLVEWNGPDERSAADALADALDNVRAAFRSAIESGSLDEAADLAVSMWRPALAGLHWDVVVWPAVVLDQHGARELANADAVIAAGGARSLVRRRLRLGRTTRQRGDRQRRANAAGTSRGPPTRRCCSAPAGAMIWTPRPISSGGSTTTPTSSTLPRSSA